MRLALPVVLTGAWIFVAAHAGAAEVARTEFLVFSQCKPGMKSRCDRWYEKHLADISRIDGVVSARQFSVVPVAGRDGMKKDRLIVYQLAGDPAAVLARLRPAVAEGRLEPPDPLLFETPFETVVVQSESPGTGGATP